MNRPLWPDDIVSARKIQEKLRERVRIVPLRKVPQTIAGVDAAFHGDTVIAVASLFSYPGLVSLEDAVCREKIRFPYVPGFLSFREGHAITDAVRGLHVLPEILLVDGQGIAHPRGIGIAAHLGVILSIPSIGCAKSRLIGTYENPGPEKGQWSSLSNEGNNIGAVLRTRKRVKPVFVSPGTMIDIPSSVEIVIHCTTKFRIPEPIRRADHIAGSLAQGRSAGTG